MNALALDITIGDKEVHPDVGGTHDKMAEVNAAKDTALATLRSRRAA